MATEKVDVLIKGGEATAAPPIGPALSPLGINIQNVLKEINSKTASFKGMEVPVKILVDTGTKEFTVTVGSPSVSAMIKKELGAKKLATVNEDKSRNMPGSIPFDAVVNIAKSKESSMHGDLKSRVKQVLGTCLSGGVTVNDKDPREVIKEVNEGKLAVE